MNNRNEYGYPVIEDLEAELEAEAEARLFREQDEQDVEDEHEEMYNHV